MLFYVWEDARVWAQWNHSLICTSAICGQHPVLSSWVSSGCTTGGGCSSWLLDGGCPFSTLSSLRAYLQSCCHVMAGWLQRPLFTEKAGNIVHTQSLASPFFSIMSTFPCPSALLLLKPRSPHPGEAVSLGTDSQEGIPYPGMCSFTRKCLWTQALSSNCQHLREFVKSHSSTNYIKCYNMCQEYANRWEHRHEHIRRACPHGAAFLQKRCFASEKSNQTPGSLTRVPSVVNAGGCSLHHACCLPSSRSTGCL